MKEDSRAVREPEEHRRAALRRFERRFTGFWTAVTYALVVLGVYELSAAQPSLLGSPAALGLATLLVGFFVLYHRVFMRCGDALPLRGVALYGAAQTLIIVLLQRYDPSFGNLSFALIAQLMSVLPSRLWPAAVLGVMPAVVLGWGVGDLLATGQWDDAFQFGFQTALWIAAFVFLILLLRQRWKLTDLVRELQAAKRELERSAAQAEELAALRERTRLAREMHDNLGHALVAVTVKLEAAERLYAVAPARGAAELEATRALVRQAMAELRISLAGLRSPLPRHGDLPDALRRLSLEVRARSGLHVDLDTGPEIGDLSSETTTALWHIAREALANVERHAGAASATVTLRRADGMVTLSIADDGSGIPSTQPSRPGHYGITGMRERAEGLGGRLRIRERPGGGTVVEACVPAPAAVLGERAEDPERPLVPEGRR
jgi:signal transduction histidine kinase